MELVQPPGFGSRANRSPLQTYFNTSQAPQASDVTAGQRHSSPAALHWVVEFPLSSCLLSLLSDWPIRYLRVRPNSHFMQCCHRVCVVFLSSSAYCECTESDRGRYRMRGPSPLTLLHRSTSIATLRNASAPPPSGQHPSLHQGVLKGKICVFFLSIIFPDDLYFVLLLPVLGYSVT